VISYRSTVNKDLNQKRLQDRHGEYAQAATDAPNVMQGMMLLQFEKAVELQKFPLKVGDWVLSHGNLCQLTSIGEDDPSSQA
jgi:hypothetical protein